MISRQMATSATIPPHKFLVVEPYLAGLWISGLKLGQLVRPRLPDMIRYQIIVHVVVQAAMNKHLTTPLPDLLG